MLEDPALAPVTTATADRAGGVQIESGRAELVLLIGADFVTRITDYDDKRSAPLFADAAGAVVLGRGGGELGDV